MKPTSSDHREIVVGTTRTNGASRCTSFVVLTAVLTLASAARGQATDRIIAAEALFRDGNELFKASRFEDAAGKFTASYRVDRAYGPLFNLARCHEELGQTATAWAEFREAIALATATRRADREEEARERALALEPRLTKLQIVVDDQTPGLWLTRNGSLVNPATWGTAVPVDPGLYSLEAAAPGRITWRTTVNAAAPGRVVFVRVPRLGNAGSSPWQQHRASMLTASGAAVLAGAGLGFGGWSAATHATLGNECSPTGGSNCAALDDVRSQATTANVLFGAAGVAAVTSALLFFVAERRGPAPPAAAYLTGSPNGLVVWF